MAPALFEEADPYAFGRGVVLLEPGGPGLGRGIGADGAAIRAALTELRSGKVIQREDACFEVDVADRIWLISPDCQSCYGVRDATSSRTPSGTGQAS